MTDQTTAEPVDTEELRLSAHYVCDNLDNGHGDDASDLMLAAADELDALRADREDTGLRQLADDWRAWAKRRPGAIAAAYQQCAAELDAATTEATR